MSDLIAVMRAGKVEQVGTPWQIYFKPENRFVADFVGTVNFLDVTITDITADSIFMDWQGNAFTMNRREYKFQSGEEASLVIRPEYMSLRPVAPDETLDTVNALRGEVTFYSFLGRFIRYWVKVNDHIFIVDDSNPSLSGAMEGEVVILLDHNKLHMLKKEKE